MATLNKMWRLIVGKPLDPLDPGTRHAIAVTPLLACVGLGADGLSWSSNWLNRNQTLTAGFLETSMSAGRAGVRIIDRERRDLLHTLYSTAVRTANLKYAV